MEERKAHIAMLDAKCKTVYEPVPRHGIKNPDKAITVARQIFELLLVHGAGDEEAARKIVELYSPPRVTKHLRQHRGGLLPGQGARACTGPVAPAAT